MTPEEKIQFNNMKIFIEDLKKSYSFPFSVQTAIVERINPILGTGQAIGSATTQSVAVASTPTNITVPAQPSGTIPLIYQGVVYNVLFK